MNLRNIKSIEEIVEFLREQARLRAPENDEGGILLQYADCIQHDVVQLEAPDDTVNLDDDEMGINRPQVLK
jgi:hypothetical protein